MMLQSNYKRIDFFDLLDLYHVYPVILSNLFKWVFE